MVWGSSPLPSLPWQKESCILGSEKKNGVKIKLMKSLIMDFRKKIVLFICRFEYQKWLRRCSSDAGPDRSKAHLCQKRLFSKL